MAEHRHVQAVRILRVDDDLRDLPSVAQAQVRPVRAAVGRFVHAVADREIGALAALAAADVDGVRRRRRDRERADRRARLIVEHRRPGAPGVGRLEDAAVDGGDVELVRPAGHPADRDRAPAAERPDRAPVQHAAQRAAHVGRDGGGGGQQRGARDEERDDKREAGTQHSGPFRARVLPRLPAYAGCAPLSGSGSRTRRSGRRLARADRTSRSAARATRRRLAASARRRAAGGSIPPSDPRCTRPVR